jgi:L-fucose isomerase-like protein
MDNNGMKTYPLPIPALGYVAIARPTFDVPFASEKSHGLYRHLQDWGYTLVGRPDLVMDMAGLEEALAHLQATSLDLLVVTQASFADSTMILHLAQALETPLVLWAFPEPRVGGRLRLNSFCGINLAAHGLKRAGLHYETIYAEPNDPAAQEKIAVLARAGAVRNQVRTMRLGRIGEHPVGFDTCRFDVEALAANFGVQVFQVALPTVLAEAQYIQTQAVSQVRQQLAQRVSGLETMDATATDKTLNTYLHLQQLTQEKQLDGLAVRCWPEFFTELGCAACGAMSLLSAEFIPCSCEADVNGTLTQLILQSISGEPAFGTDIVAFDTAENVGIVWHCGLAPLSMADPDVQPRVALHSNRQLPLLMEFPLKPGRVTFARLSEATGTYRLVIGGGEMLKAPPSFTGTTGTLRFDCGAQAAMETLLAEGLEHHISLTYGEHRPVLRALAHLWDINILEF